MGERWALLVLRELFWGNHRFAEIALEKRRYGEHPPRDGYHLTKAGFDLAPVLASLVQWSRRHLPAREHRPNVAHHDHEIDPVVEVRCRVGGERVV